MTVQFYGDVRLDDLLPVLWVDGKPRLPRRHKFVDGWEAQRYGHMLKNRYARIFGCMVK